MASRRNGTRPDHQRAAIANEAARIMAEHGVADFRVAKARAAERLGARASGPLPSNAEVEAALAERNRIFRPTAQNGLVQGLRRAAMQVMERLTEFQPRLVGPVLSGQATEHSPIDLHLFAEAPELVAIQLERLGFEPRAIGLRHRWRRGEDQQLPGYRFFASNEEFLATVFNDRQRAHAPLSPVDQRPMSRAGLRQVAELLGEAAISER